MYRYEKKNQRFCTDGVEILRLSLSYPRFERYKIIDEYYNMLADNCVLWCTSELYERVKMEYNADTDPRKRFGFNKYTYVCDFVVTSCDESFICVRTDISLLRGRKEKITEYTDAQVWKKTNESVMSPLNVLAEHKMGKSHKKYGKYKIMIAGGRLMRLEDNMWKNIS